MKHTDRLTTSVLPLLTLIPLLGTLGCQLDDGSGEDPAEFRASMFAEAWSIQSDRRVADAGCDELMDELCAELSAGECAVARTRTICEPIVSGKGEVQGSVLRDGYGARVDWTGVDILDVVGYLFDLEWAGYSVGDEGVSSAPGDASASKMCATMKGAKVGTCLAMTHAAELARDESATILDAFPQGGVGTLSEHDGVLVISTLESEPGLDLVTATAKKLGWRMPMLEGEVVLGEGSGTPVPGGCTITVVPNGGVTIASKDVLIAPQPLPKPASPAANNFSYSMSAPGANYDQQHADVVGGWSRYAALWKSFHDAMVGTVDVTAAYAGSALDPLLGADATLDAHEAAHFTDVWGQSYDPRGDWYSIDIDDPMTGLAYAAIAMHYWGTPVFVSGDWSPSPWIAPSGSWYGDIAIEQLSFSSPQFTSLEDACGIAVGDSAAAALNKITSGTSTCALTGVTLTGGVVSAWLGDFSPMNAPGLLHHQGISGGDLLGVYAAGYTWSPGFPSGRVGELVLDPPETASDEEIQAIGALAEAIGQQLNEQVSPGELVEEAMEPMQMPLPLPL